MDFNHIKKIAERFGIQAELKGFGHVHLKGIVLVNYYPDSRRQSAYIAGTNRAFHGMTVETAVMLAMQPRSTGVKEERGNQTRAKRRMLRRDARCYYCKRELRASTATVDHRIPLSGGGLDNNNNRVLACADCNRAKADSMPKTAP